MKRLLGLLFVVGLPTFAASPIQGTRGLHCFEILDVARSGPVADANLTRHDLICAVDGIRFGIEHDPQLKDDPDSMAYFVDYVESSGKATLEVHRDGVAYQTTVDLGVSGESFGVRIWPVFVQMGPTHGRAKRMGIQDGDILVSIGDAPSLHLLDRPLPDDKQLTVAVRRGKNNIFELADRRAP